MGRRILTVALTGLVLVGVACGISVVTTETISDDEAGAPKSPNTTPTTPAPSDGDARGNADALIAPPPDCASGTCGFTVPAGWSIIAFGPRTIACPTGFDTNDIVESPTPGAGACSCAAAPCTIATQPNCLSGSIRSTLGSTSTCSSQGAVNQFANGNCQQVSNTFGQYSGFPAAPPPSSPGTCSAGAPVANTGAVTTTALRSCRPSSSSRCDAVCDPSMPPALRACLIASGDVSCPVDAPTKHLVGTGVDVTCGSCPSCTVSSTGCAGSMTFYSDSNCTNVVKVIATNSCVNAGGASFNSYKWAATATGVSCVASGTAIASTTLTSMSTVCCKP